MAISAQHVKDLRDRTNLPMLKCKEALVASDGDMEAAIEWLRKQGLATAAKKSGRCTKTGSIAIACRPGTAVMVLLGCETDFVAKNTDFQAFASRLAELALQTGVQSADDLAVQTIDGLPAKEAVAGLVGKIGENLAIAEVRRLEGPVDAAYNHNTGRVAALVAGQGDPAVLRTIAMHVAASNPAPLTTARSEVPAETLAKEREIIAATPEVQAKPEAIRPKVVEGKLVKFYKDFVLLDQEMLLDNSEGKNVADWAKAKGASVQGFARIAV